MNRQIDGRGCEFHDWMRSGFGGLELVGVPSWWASSVLGVE